MASAPGRRRVRLALIVIGAAAVLCAVGVTVALRLTTPVYVPVRDDRPAPPPVAMDRPPYALPPGLAAALGEAESLEVHLIGLRRPAGLPEGAPLPPLPADRAFHDHEILGTARVSSPEQVDAILADLLRGVETHDADPVGCFFPRHGVRAKLSDGRAIDLAIGFHCQTMEVHVPGRPAETVYLYPLAMGRLNDALRSAGIDLEQEVLPYLPPAV